MSEMEKWKKMMIREQLIVISCVSFVILENTLLFIFTLNEVCHLDVFIATSICIEPFLFLLGDFERASVKIHIKTKL